MTDVPIILSEKFSKNDGIKFSFSTRKGGVSPELYGMNLSFNVGDERLNVLKNREIFFGILHIGLDELAIPRQVQGGLVRRVYVQGGYDACDGLITNSYGVFLTVSVADCLPVFLYDPVKKAIGVVHAGWRGSEMKIVSRAVALMKEEFETSPSDLIAYVGPAAGVCCYEVGEDVAGKFDNEFVIRTYSREPHLDMKLFTKDQLIKSGVKEANIEISDYCTICRADLFHSYRRDCENSGRMMGVIGLVR
ncbi:MAG: peptidoglycan editing factor PgeF [Bacteroidetes bacterium]|nr:peptidoglycan editing factor PgeF [Bacteroidota bacterium]MBU1423314.1 peptidoglycan editing factor PgeF [Bacteroidota bacterium]MBU2471707.1 peptidoglycan editing factor PgeF [Bacteroidota bacterium]